MKIHFIHPFSLEKKYGKELNATMQMIPDGDWCAIMDWDCMLLCPEQVDAIYRYVQMNPDAGMLVAKSNRSGSVCQRDFGKFDSSDWMRVMHERSNEVLRQFPKQTELDNNISGYLMLISKATWNEIKFSEELNILHVDRDYARKLKEAGKKIILMDAIYVWHSYRIWKNVSDKTHLV